MGTTQSVPLSHNRVPLLQLVAQVPAEQTWPAGHVVPQPPQFWLSDSGFTQAPPHRSEPTGQTIAQVPERQLFPTSQA